MTFDECLRAVEEAFRLYAEGQTLKPELLHVEARGGEFHVKAGGLRVGQSNWYFALKANGGFFRNQELRGMPNIQGTITLADAENGYPLAIMDSTEITRQRTGAATAVAAKYLARPDSSVVTICGAGNQARVQIKALAHVLPLKRAYIFGRDRERASLLAAALTRELGFEVTAVSDLSAALIESQVCVTCTPARGSYLRKEDVPRGMFIAAVGADSPDKQELDPRLVADCKLVVDILEQCAHVGELHQAIKAGLMKREDASAELGQVVAGQKRGRTEADEVIVFDSTGTAFQDAAAAALVYEKAVSQRTGTLFDFFG